MSKNLKTAFRLTGVCPKGWSTENIHIHLLYKIEDRDKSMKNHLLSSLAICQFWKKWNDWNFNDWKWKNEAVADILCEINEHFA